MKKSKIKYYFLIVVGIILFIIGGTFSFISGSENDSPPTAYYDTKNIAKSWIQTPPLGNQDWKPVDVDIAFNRPQRFIEAFNSGIVDEKTRRETLQKRNPNIELNPKSITSHLKLDNEGKIIDPKNPNVRYDLKVFPQGTEVLITSEEIIIKTSRGIYVAEYGIGNVISVQNPQPSSPMSAPYAGGGGGGGGGSGGIEEAFQQAMSLAQQAGSLLSGIAASLKSNGKGKTTTSENNKGGITATLEGGAAIALTKEEKEKLLAMQNDEAKPATIEISGSAPEAQITNANVLVPEQLAAKVNEETTLSLKGIDGNDPSHPPLTDQNPVQLASVIPTQTNSITAAAIQENFGQYIKLLDHDLDVSGRDLVIYNLKTFNNVEAGGQDIHIFSGDIEIKIEGQRIMYPRLVKKAPYGIAQLSNKLDRENTFKLQHYENRKGLLYDNRQITSVGDVIVKHPQKNLVVSKIRGDMWEN